MQMTAHPVAEADLWRQTAAAAAASADPLVAANNKAELTKKSSL